MMDNIVYLKDFLRGRGLNEDLIPFFRNLNLSYQHFVNEDEALFIVKTTTYLFIFLTYIPKNLETTLPSIVDRFHDIKHNPRISKGEWVVEHIYDVNSKHALKFLQRLENGSQGIPDIVQLKNKIKD